MTRINSAHTSATDHTSEAGSSGTGESAARRGGTSRKRGATSLGGTGSPQPSAPKRAATGGGESANPPVRAGADKLLRAHTRFFDDNSVSVRGFDVSPAGPGAEGQKRAVSQALRGTPELSAMLTATVDTMAQHPLENAHASRNATGDWMSDSHFHPTNYVQQGMVPREMLKMMDEVGIHRAVMSPIPTDVMPCGSHDEHTHAPNHNNIPAESYYVQQKYTNIQPHELTQDVEKEITQGAHLMLNQQVDADTALFMQIAQLSHAERDRLDPMVTGLHLGSPLSPQALLLKLATHPGMFTGVGEVTIHKELVQQQYEGSRQANLTNNVQSFKHLVATAGVIGMPVVLHCDVDSTENQRANGIGQPQYLNDLKKLFASPETSKTTLIWAHCGGIGRFVRKPIDHANNLRTILSDPKMSHIHIDISWSRVARQIVMKTQPDGTEVPDHESVHAWAALINEFPDRFLFGSDALNPQVKDTWAETGNMYKPLLDKLTPEARVAVKTGNYDRVITEARPKVRAFEQHVLTRDFVEKGLRSSGDGRVNDGPHINPDALRAACDEAYANAGVDLTGRPLDAAVH
ncbi:hypothetical protein SAMN05446635_5538 [Burkholderia sp. OK233]|nr:hypothetical protein SAMN05446635_5538 [Burkholderia sp. OK233]